MRGGALNLKEQDFVCVEHFRNRLHEVEELNEDEDPVFGQDALSAAEKSGIVSTPRKQYVLNQVDDLF